MLLSFACGPDERADTTTFADEAEGLELDADEAPEGSSADTTTSGQSTDSSSSDADEGVKFDVGAEIDLPGGDPIPPTCATIDDYPATSVGCEFFAVQVPSFASELPYGIAVGNPSADVASVTIEDMRGPGGTLRQITSFQLAPTESQLTAINGVGGLLAENHMVDGIGLNDRAGFRVRSDVPVTAMQLFPVGGGPSHVSEASMLLPVNALDQSYIAASWPAFAEGQSGFVLAVAIEDATTVLTDQGDVMLDAFDVWHFAAGPDATGFFVGADKPIALFSGIDCTMIPALPWYACDHIEEQMLPLSAWGTHYVGARHPQRVPELNPAPEEVYWRVIAGVANTTITLDPPVAAPINLGAVGAFAEFASTQSFTATGDNPFLLVQYMSGCYNVIDTTPQTGNCDQGATGDPYMLQAVPVEQWLTQLPFLTDTSYPRDFVTIIREVGTTVNLECLGEVSADHFTAIPGTPYEVGQVDLDIAGSGGEGSCVDGAQFLTASAPVGVMVGGVDWATSYGYPGGLSLDALWEPPIEPEG
ncbi:IgGFc-binding protein [Nannocystaceae bacterium ST9]